MHTTSKLTSPWSEVLSASSFSLGIACNLLTDRYAVASIVIGLAIPPITLIVILALRRWGPLTREMFTRRTVATIAILTLVPLVLAGSGAYLTRDTDGVPAAGHLKAQLRVANQTRGDTEYAVTTTARYDEVVKFELEYANTGSRRLTDLIPSFRFVDGPGRFGKLEAIVRAGGQSTTVGARVDLGREDAVLQFIPGTIYWRHNVAQPSEHVEYRTVHLDDAPVTSGSSYPIDSSVAPNGAQPSTITIMARVTAPGVGIKVLARGPEGWRTDLNANPGDRVRLQIRVRNLGNLPLRDVAVRFNQPPGVAIQDGEAVLAVTGRRVATIPASNVPFGLRLDTVPIGGRATVAFTVVVGQAATPGSVMRGVGVIKAAGLNEYFNTVDLLVR